FWTGGSGYAIAKNTKHKKLAWELLKTVSGEKGQIQLAIQGMAQPAYKHLAYSKVWAKDTNTKPQNKAMLNDAIDHIIFYPRLVNWRKTLYRTVEIRDLIIRKEISLDEGLRRADRVINKAITEEKL
ncbi:MAG TPA: hypothetical protein VKS21_07265, partial [Spirochaetota bacterium]|nr:hypothetical protein [Spirochaetota bacterium]